MESADLKGPAERIGITSRFTWFLGVVLSHFEASVQRSAFEVRKLDSCHFRCS